MIRRILFSLACFILTGSLTNAQPVGVAFYNDLGALPYIYPDIESYYLSSYDRTGGNDDGFRGTYSQLYIDSKGKHVIFEEDGPGCVYNLWFTGSGRNLHWGKIRFYFDGEEKPRIEYEAKEFFSGQHPPFIYPLVTHSFISSGGFSCSVPIEFAKHLKITTDKTVGFYNIYYQLYKNVNVTTWTEQQSVAPLVNLFERCGSDPKGTKEKIHIARQTAPLEPVSRKGKPEVELLSTEGGGCIQYIKINPLYAPDTYSLNHVHLRIFYDGRSDPNVDVPIGPFFGSGLGEADVRGLFVGMSSSGTYYCYIPIPYRKAVKVTLQNRSNDKGGQFFCEIGYTKTPLPPQKGATIGYFGARYNKAWPIVEEEDYVLFDYEGAGAIVGQVMTVEPVKADRKRWWEGDMRIYIDGEEKPRFHGTGHEDEYQGGWSTFWLTNPYSLPLFGQPKTEGLINVFGQAIAPIDVAIALEHICLQATELGLGTCWIGAFDSEKARAILGIPDEIIIVELMAVGYPADTKPEPKRESIDKIVCYEKWTF